MVLAPLDLHGGAFELASGSIGSGEEGRNAAGLAHIVNVAVSGRTLDNVVQDVMSAIAGEAESG